MTTSLLPVAKLKNKVASQAHFGLQREDNLVRLLLQRIKWIPRSDKNLAKVQNIHIHTDTLATDPPPK